MRNTERPGASGLFLGSCPGGWQTPPVSHSQLATPSAPGVRVLPAAPPPRGCRTRRCPDAGLRPGREAGMNCACSAANQWPSGSGRDGPRGGLPAWRGLCWGRSGSWRRQRFLSLPGFPSICSSQKQGVVAHLPQVTALPVVPGARSLKSMSPAYSAPAGPAAPCHVGDAPEPAGSVQLSVRWQQSALFKKGNIIDSIHLIASKVIVF